MATAARSELGADTRLREFLHQTYDELQRDVAKARTELERQEKEYGDAIRHEMANVCDPLRPGRLRAENPAVASDLPSDSDAASSVQSEKPVIMKHQPRLEDVTFPEKITDYNELSLRDLADLISDTTFRINLQNNRQQPRGTNKTNPHATRNEQERLDEKDESIPAPVPHRQAPVGQQQGAPGIQRTVGVQTGVANQKAETMKPAVVLSHQRGVAQFEPTPGEPTRHETGLQATARVQPGRAALQTVCAQITEDSTFSVSLQHTAPRKEMGPNAGALLSRSNKEGATPAKSASPTPQYPGMVQIGEISGKNSSGPRVEATRAPVGPQGMHVPTSGIPGRTEAEPSSHEAAPVGDTQQPPDYRVEQERADDGAVPIFTTRIRSTTKISTTSESGTSMTRISTENEINLPGSNLRVTVSQRLETMDARGLYTVHDEDETVIRKALVPGRRVGVPPSSGRDESDDAQVESQDQDHQNMVRYVMHQAPSPTSSHPTLKRGQEFVHGFVPRPPVLVEQDDAGERVLGRTQVDSGAEELEAAYTHVKGCSNCCCYFRKVGVKLLELSCDKPQPKRDAGGEASAARDDTRTLPPKTTRTESPSCALLCWDVEGLSADVEGLYADIVEVPEMAEPLATLPHDRCSTICWQMSPPTTDKRAPERQLYTRPPAPCPRLPPPKTAARELRAALQRAPEKQTYARSPAPRPGVPPSKPAAQESRAVPQHAPQRQNNTIPNTPYPATTSPPQPATRGLRADPQVKMQERRLHCCPPCNAKAAGAAQGHAQEQRGVHPQGVQPQGVQPQGMELRGMQPRGVEQRGVQPQGMEQRGVQPQGVQLRGVQPRSMQPQGVEPQGVGQRRVQPQGVQLRGVQPRGMQPQGVEPQGVQPQGLEQRGVQSRGMEPRGVVQRGVEPDLYHLDQELLRMDQEYDLRPLPTEPRYVAAPQRPSAPPTESPIPQETRALPAQPRQVQAVQSPSAVPAPQRPSAPPAESPIPQETRALPAQPRQVQAVQPPSAVLQPTVGRRVFPTIPGGGVLSNATKVLRVDVQETVETTATFRPFAVNDAPMFRPAPHIRAPRQQGQDFWCCENCTCTVLEDNFPDMQLQAVRSPTAPQVEEASHEAASDRKPVSMPKEEDDECILEPYVERFHFKDEELANAFPRKDHAVVPRAVPTSVHQETVESVVSQQHLSIVSSNGQRKTLHIKQHSKTEIIQRFSHSPRTEISETSAPCLDPDKLKCDDKARKFFQVTSKSEDSQELKFHIKQDTPEERALPPESIEKVVHPSKPETETVSRDDESQKQPNMEHESCHLLCWNRKDDDSDAMKCRPEADPVTKYDSSCMVHCWGEMPTDDAKSASDISGEESLDANSTDKATTDVSNGTQIQEASTDEAETDTVIKVAINLEVHREF